MEATGKKNAISPKACSLLRQIYRLHQGCNRVDRARHRQGSTLQQLETARYDIAPQDPHSGARSQGSVLAFDRSAVCTTDNCTFESSAKAAWSNTSRSSFKLEILQSVPKNAKSRGRLVFLASATDLGKSVSSLASHAKKVCGKQTARHA